MSKTTIFVDHQPVQIEAQPLTVLCHNQPMKIEAPTYFEINGRNTLDCIDAMKQEHWDHIRTGGMFKPLFDIVFQDSNVELPEAVEDLKDKDDAIKHVAGLVILMFEHAFIKGEQLFLKLPETHLHPAQTRHLVDLVTQIQRLCDGKPNVLTKTVDKPKPKKKRRKKK